MNRPAKNSKVSCFLADTFVVNFLVLRIQPSEVTTTYSYFFVTAIFTLICYSIKFVYDIKYLGIQVANLPLQKNTSLESDKLVGHLNLAKNG